MKLCNQNTNNIKRMKALEMSGEKNKHGLVRIIYYIMLFDANTQNKQAI